MDKKKEMSDIIKGLELTLSDLNPRLTNQVDGLSTKKLRRVLKATINYITTRTDSTDVMALGEEEKLFIGGMFAAVESSVQYSLHIISEIQKEELKKRQKEEESNE